MGTDAWRWLKKKKKKKELSHKKGARSATRSHFTIQKRASVKSHTVKPKFHKNVPMSIHDLLEWCRYLDIPIKDVLLRDQTVPHNHKPALVIYNLEPA